MGIWGFVTATIHNLKLDLPEKKDQTLNSVVSPKDTSYHT